MYINLYKYSWLYKLFQSKLERELKKTLTSKICDIIYATPSEWNSVISSFPCKRVMTGYKYIYAYVCNNDDENMLYPKNALYTVA